VKHAGKRQAVFQLREAFTVLPSVDSLLIDHQCVADLGDPDAAFGPHTPDVLSGLPDVDLRNFHHLPP